MNQGDCMYTGSRGNFGAGSGTIRDARIFAIATTAFFLCLLLHSLTTAKPPNFIVILTDDQGYADVGCYGSGSAPFVTPWKSWDTIPISTPRLDRMASEGVRFTSFYSGFHICSPSRLALLTGCYANRLSLTWVLQPKDSIGINPNEITIAELLKARGYATGIFGKWHLGHLSRFLPTNNGFDTFFGIPYSNDMTISPSLTLASNILCRENWTRAQILELQRKTIAEIESLSKNKVPLMRNEEIIEFPADQATLTKRYTDEAIQFIKNNSAKPFFIYIPHTMPHVPLASTSQFTGSPRGAYGNAISELDWNVGRLLDSLESLGKDDSTFVIYTSDNGPWLDKGQNGGTAFPFRNGKFFDREGGIRVPCIMRWPGKIPAGLVQHEFAALIDIYPTLAKLSTADCQPLPARRIIDGLDIWPLISGSPGAQTPHDAFYYTLNSVRSGNWKFKDTTSSGWLFKLDSDPHEDTNVVAMYPAKAAELKSKLSAFATSLDTNRRSFGTMKTVIQKAGCTNASSPNYDPTAQIDDGSCKCVVNTLSGNGAARATVNSMVISVGFNTVSHSLAITFLRTGPMKTGAAVSLKLVNMRGAVLRTLTVHREASRETVTWNIRKVPSGLYFVAAHDENARSLQPVYVQ